MPKATVAVIGGGNMGEALIKGLYKDYTVLVCEADKLKASALRKKYRVELGGFEEVVSRAKIIVLAIKPQDMPALLERFQKNTDKLFISIAAGLTTSFFEKCLGKVRVVRSMPNMPALIGRGITGLCAGRYARVSDIKTAQSILRTVGQTVVVKESMIDALTAVSGSGPAYVFLLAEQWIMAAEKLGFKKAEAKQLVYQTLLGSAHLLETSAFDAGELRAKVTSKGGTTQAALDIFAQRHFDKTVFDALAAAKKRARELAR